MSTRQARGARLVARGKSRAFDGKSPPLASGPAPLARPVAIAAVPFMNMREKEIRRQGDLDPEIQETLRSMSGPTEELSVRVHHSMGTWETRMA